MALESGNSNRTVQWGLDVRNGAESADTRLVVRWRRTADQDVDVGHTWVVVTVLGNVLERATQPAKRPHRDGHFAAGTALSAVTGANSTASITT